MGLIVSAYGPLLEHLTRRFGVSLPVAGATISIHFAGSLIGVFVAMRSMHAWPARNTVVAAMGCVAAGCAAVALAPSWPAFVGAVFVIGVGFGALRSEERRVGKEGEVREGWCVVTWWVVW